jgi:hypothetical protein
MTDTATKYRGVTVYCGSAPGRDSRYTAVAAAVGEAIAAAAVPLIYGGGRMGLMGAAGHACRHHGGSTVAVIPQFMVERGWNDPESTHTIVTDGMHSRKELMAASAIGAIALPGGIGTFEELAELITWRQLGLYDGNIVILNLDGYYDPFIAQLNRAVSEGFLPADHTQMWTVVATAQQAVDAALASHHALHLKPKF